MRNVAPPEHGPDVDLLLLDGPREIAAIGPVLDALERWVRDNPYLAEEPEIAARLARLGRARRRAA